MISAGNAVAPRTPRALDRWASLPIPLFLFAVLALAVAQPVAKLTAPQLLAALNLVFITAVALVIAALMVRSFLALGHPGLLLLGCGALIWGAGGTFGPAAALSGIGPSAYDAGALVTIHNISTWLAAACHLAGAALWTGARINPRTRAFAVAIAYALALAAAAAIANLAIAGLLPTMFIPGHGGTPARYWLLGSAVVMFALSARLLTAGRHDATGFAHWYARALLLLAVGIGGVMLQTDADTPLNWTARAAQYLGGVYMVAAAAGSAREAPVLLLFAPGTGTARQRYFVAVALVAAATAIRLTFLEPLGTTLAFITFYPAVMLAALYGGLLPGLLATALSATVANYFWMEPVGVLFAVERPIELLGVGVFLLSGLMMSWIADEMQRAQQRAGEAEGQVLAQRDRLRHILESLPQFTWTARPDGLRDYNSPQLAAYAGVPGEAALGEGWLDQVHPEDRAAARASWREALARGGPFDTEHRLRAADGRYRWFKVRAVAERDGAGRIRQWFGSSIDVDDLRRTEQELAQHRDRLEELVQERTVALEHEIADRTRAEAEARESASRARARSEELDAVIEAIPAPVWIALDPECREVRANREAQELLGIGPERDFTAALDPHHVEIRHDGRRLLREQLPLQQAAATGQRVALAELEVLRHDGSVRHLYGSAVPLYHPDGRVRGAVAAFTDVTALKRAEQALRAADRRKDEFLATLAHELRNPLAPLRNALELLRRAEHDAALRARVQAMAERQVAHMVRLIDDLLDLSRITTGKLRLRPELIDLRDVAAAAAEAAQPLMRECGHTMQTSVPDAPLTVMGDPARLNQIVSNLLTNAAKYTERGGRIVLALARENEDAVITVTDTGLGIPADKLEAIFEMFAQVHGARGYGPEGLGIGLNLVKRLVELHGGAVAARSAGPKLGSEFRVRLPLARPAGAGDGAQPAPAQVPGRLHVLVVDDNVDAAESLALLLQLIGHEARRAHDGLAAIVAAEDLHPDLVLLDLGMPKMDGYEVARHLRAQPWGRALRLVALTGWGQEEDKRRSRDAGFDDHLIKPVQPDELQRLLAETAARRGATSPSQGLSGRSGIHAPARSSLSPGRG